MKCAGECPTTALEQTGVLMEARDLMVQVKKDAVLHRNSGGGVTFSGGEPLQQPEFLLELLAACKREGLHTAIDTCGAVPWEVIERTIPFTDLFLYDIKHTSRKDVASGQVLENAGKLADMGSKIWFRVPLIPDFNASPDEIEKIGAFIKSLRPVERINLLPFHRFPENKYQMLGLNWKFADVEELKSEEVAKFRDILSDVSGHAVIIGG